MHSIFKAATFGTAIVAIAVPLPAIVTAQTTATGTGQQSTWNRTHRVIIQVTQNDPAVMNLALNNTENLVNYYKDKGEPLEVELVAFGAGLNMVRSDTSPVKQRLEAIAASMKNVTFTGCGNTLNTQSQQEHKQISLVPQAHLVTAGIARVVELEEAGWTYVRP